MVYTLQRYIFKELMRIFVLTVIALTLMLSPGSMIEPIQKYGASPLQVLWILIYTLPIILTFVLPVSAIFASALVYGRFANDNELDACRASGISILTMIYPGLFLALLVSICNLVLSFHVMPQFIHMAQQVVQSDAKQICFRNIQRKGHYNIPGSGYKIKADYVDLKEDQLLGVVIVEYKNDTFRKTIEADSANVKILPQDKFSELNIVATDVYQTDIDGSGVYSRRLPLKYRFENLLGDNIRFKRLKEIKQIRENPTEFYPIHKMVEKAYVQLIMEALGENIRDAFKDDQQGGYYRNLKSDQKHLVFKADQCVVKSNSTIELSGNVSFIENDAENKSISQWQCNRAIIQPETELDTSSFVMTLYEAVRTGDSGEVQLRFRPFFRNLKLPLAIKEKLPDNKLKAVTALARKDEHSRILKSPSVELKTMVRDIGAVINETLVEIKTEISSRLVFGVGCIVLILISIGLGIFYKGGHVLVAFAISMLPAAFLVICMMGGKNMAKNAGAHGTELGISLMWIGLGVLVIVLGYIMRKLLKL